jgi:hypothetical protein
MRKSPATDDDIRARLETIALEAFVDCSDQSEPLQELIERIRANLQEELVRLSQEFDGLEAELDEFQQILIERPPQAKPENTP